MESATLFAILADCNIDEEATRLYRSNRVEPAWR